jgi:hypothetical protein
MFENIQYNVIGKTKMNFNDKFILINIEEPSLIEFAFNLKCNVYLNDKKYKIKNNENERYFLFANDSFKIKFVNILNIKKTNICIYVYYNKDIIQMINSLDILKLGKNNHMLTLFDLLLHNTLNKNSKLKYILLNRDILYIPNNENHMYNIIDYSKKSMEYLIKFKEFLLNEINTINRTIDSMEILANVGPVASQEQITPPLIESEAPPIIEEIPVAPQMPQSPQVPKAPKELKIIYSYKEAEFNENKIINKFNKIKNEHILEDST